ncbi:hypothetical protein CDN99_13330 [Roseateles aquatilis]|uniref:PBS lyase n=1 Tax=Roseateles aquatilis TaxID=431061 RepID=A0A246JCH5_9BURK|nr:hypothetical protein CDN99_13330 [Roseateles aquatilis]
MSRPAPVAPATQEWLPLLESRSGYQRQEAIQALASMRSHEALPLLLRRVNDWVPEVRAAARLAVLPYLQDDCLPAWRGAMPALAEILRGRRADHGPLLKVVAEFLRTPDRAGLLRGSSPLLRRWLTAAEWQAAPEPRRLAMLAERLRDSDVAAARWALDRVEELCEAASRPPLWLIGCANAHGLVRAHALRRLRDEVPSMGDTMASRLALDRHALVRAVALAQLRKNGDLGTVVARAEEQLSAPALTPRGAAPALLFLAVVDPKGATARCERLVGMTGADRTRTALRVLALQHLIAATDGDAQMHWMTSALADDHAKVQRVASVAIARGAIPPSPEVLLPIVLAHGDLGALCRGLGILRYRSLWRQFRALLDLSIAALPEGGAEAVTRAFVQWDASTRIGVSPPAAPVADELRALWHQRASALPPRLRDRIEYSLASIGLLTLEAATTVAPTKKTSNTA